MLTVRRLFSIYILALLVVALVFVNCGDDTPDQPVDPLADAVLAVSATTAEVGAEGEASDAIEVTNSGNDAALRWVVSSTSTWITFTSSSGTTPSEFQIGGEANETGAERSGTATVTAPDLDQAALTIAVTQPTTASAFCVSDSEWTAAALGEESPYIFLDNCGNANALDWEATQTAGWFTLSTTSGSTPDSFTITAGPNNTGEAWEDTITVSSGADTSYIVLEQPAVVSLASLGYDWDGSAEDVFVSGDYAYVADEQRALLIFDLTDEISPETELTPVATFVTTGYVAAVHVFGDYAFVAEGGDGVEIVDISDPAAPVLAGNIGTTGNAYDVYVRFGDTAYVAEDTDGLVMYDIADVGAVTEAGYYDTDGYAVGVHVSGSYAYVADGSNGLVIVDIETAGSPDIAGTFPLADAEAVAVVGDQAYVGDVFTGLYIVDASDATSPTQVGTYTYTYNEVSGVCVSGDYAFMAVGTDGLLVIDISDPATPVLVGSYDTDGEAYAVYVSGDLALVADGDNGLVVLRLEL